MMKGNKIIIVSIFFLVGCGERLNECLVTANKVLRNNELKVFTDTSLHILKDKGKDSVQGGRYAFYPNGCLRAYRFFRTELAYTYSEEFSENGEIIKVEGKPLVFQNIRELKKDSFNIDLFFFSLNRVYTNTIISIDSIGKFVSTPQPDSIYSNLQRISFGVNAAGLNRLKILIYSEFHRFCEAKSEVLRDTISFNL